MTSEWLTEQILLLQNWITLDDAIYWTAGMGPEVGTFIGPEWILSVVPSNN